MPKPFTGNTLTITEGVNNILDKEGRLVCTIDTSNGTIISLPPKLHDNWRWLLVDHSPYPLKPPQIIGVTPRPVFDDSYESRLLSGELPLTNEALERLYEKHHHTLFIENNLERVFDYDANTGSLTYVQDFLKITAGQEAGERPSSAPFWQLKDIEEGVERPDKPGHRDYPVYSKAVWCWAMHAGLLADKGFMVKFNNPRLRDGLYALDNLKYVKITT